MVKYFSQNTIDDIKVQLFKSKIDLLFSNIVKVNENSSFEKMSETLKNDLVSFIKDYNFDRIDEE